MKHQEAEKILNSKVCFFRESSDKEKEIFADETKKNGAFFTIGLESGQNFVSHFAQTGIGVRTKKTVLTFRPLNEMIKGFEEVSYAIPVHFVGDFLEGSHESFKFTEDLSEDDCDSLMDVLAIGRPGAMDDHPDSPYFLDKALQVAKAYFKVIDTQKSYEKTLIPESKEKVNKTLTPIQKIKSTKSR